MARGYISNRQKMLLLWGAVSLASHHASAQPLFTEAFDAAQPGSIYSSSILGTGFQVTGGDVDIIGTILNGAASGFHTCPDATISANNCLDINGNQPGAITTTTGFNLTAGTTYKLTFDLGGSDPVTADYAVQANIGNSQPFVFSIPAGRPFGTETVLYTPTTNETAAHVSFSSKTSVPGNSQYGALIDNVSLATAKPTALAAALGPELMWQQDLSSAIPGANYTGPLPDTGFTVTSGNVDVFGDGTGTAAFYTCPAPLPSSGTCVDLNGSKPGTIQSDQVFDLLAGSSYTVDFELAGNIPNGDLSAYTMTASFGNSGAFGFRVPVGSAFQPESFTYTPTADESDARLILASTQTSDSLLYGPIITDMSIIQSPASSFGSSPEALPEPSAVLVLLTGLLAVALSVRHRQGKPE